MGVCCVFGCPNRTDRHRKSGVAFHRFPKDEKFKKQWVNAVRRLNWTPGPNSFICTEHFADTDVNRTYASGPRLREKVVPTIFRTYPPHLQPVTSKARKPPRERSTPQIEACESSNTSSHDDPSATEDLQLEAEARTKDASVQVEDSTSVALLKVEKFKNSNNLWQINQLKSKLIEKSIKIKRLRQQNSRMNKTISRLKGLISNLKSKHRVDDMPDLILP